MKKIVVTRHKVGDFDTWLKGHQDRLDLFGPAISDLKTFQDVDDPNSVVLVMELTDMDKFKAILMILLPRFLRRNILYWIPLRCQCK